MAIIGVSGYAGSGKDTVGKMIQIANCVPNSITTPLEELLADYDNQRWWLEEQSGWEIKKWAGKLKVVASLLTGIPIEKFEDQEFKKTDLGPEWSQLVWNDPDPIEGNVYRINSRIQYDNNTSLITYNSGISEAEVFNHEIETIPMSVRDFLQKLGTDGLRDGLHPNTWVNALMAEYQNKITGFDSKGNDAYPNWIITDTRFPNEAQAIKKAGGFIIRVDRPGVNAINAHPSETALDNWEFDYRIGNASDLTSLMLTVRTILINEKVLV